MAAPAEVSEKRSNFRIRQKRLFIIVANLTLNTMASFVILLIACTARIACSDIHTYIHTDRQTHETTTVTPSAHARRGLMSQCASTGGYTDLLFYHFFLLLLRAKRTCSIDKFVHNNDAFISPQH